jgi:hypothetical protein
MGVSGDDYSILCEAIATLKEGRLDKFAFLQESVEASRSPVRFIAAPTLLPVGENGVFSTHGNDNGNGNRRTSDVEARWPVQGCLLCCLLRCCCTVSCRVFVFPPCVRLLSDGALHASTPYPAVHQRPPWPSPAAHRVCRDLAHCTAPRHGASDC